MNKSIVTIILALILSVVLIGSVSALGAQWTKEKLTSTESSNSNVDLAIDSSDVAHKVYERSGSIYYSNSDDKTEVLVSAGTNPSIAVGPDKKPQVVFLLEGKWVYAIKNGNSWDLTVGDAANFVDIAVDKNNKAHVTFSANTGYNDIYYTNNVVGSFLSASMIADSNYYDHQGSYFYYPSIKVDNDGYYHISLLYQNWGGQASWSAEFAFITTNAPSGSGTSQDFGWSSVGVGRNAIGLDKYGNELMVYTQGGNIHLGIETSTGWKDKILGTGSNPTLDVKGDKIDVTYVDTSNNIMYMEATIPSDYPTTDILFDTPSSLDVGAYPVVGIGSRVVDYIKNVDGMDQVFEAYTDRPSAPSGGSGGGSSDPLAPSTVTGVVYFGNGSTVNGADVDVICEHSGTNSTQSAVSNSVGQYYVVFDGLDCYYGDKVWVTATFDSKSGHGTGTMCSADTCELLPVAIVDVTIPEFGILGAMIIVLAGIGIIAYKRNN